jgi:hypothetical protein
MANGALVIKDFMVIPTCICLISKEVDFLVVARDYMMQAVSLIPTDGEHIKTNLTP